MANAKSVLLEEVEKVCAPLLLEHAAELVDLEFVHEHGQWVLRFFLDKENRITLDDCAIISDELGRVLDTTELIPQSYSLEVSSPGINRPLKKQGDFERFKGERVEVTLFAPLDGRRHFKGVIENVAPGILSVKDVSQKVFALELGNIAKARLDPEIEI